MKTASAIRVASPRRRQRQPARPRRRPPCSGSPASLLRCCSAGRPPAALSASGAPRTCARTILSAVYVLDLKPNSRGIIVFSNTRPKLPSRLKLTGGVGNTGDAVNSSGSYCLPTNQPFACLSVGDRRSDLLRLSLSVYLLHSVWVHLALGLSACRPAVGNRRSTPRLPSAPCPSKRARAHAAPAPPRGRVVGLGSRPR